MNIQKTVSNIHFNIKSPLNTKVRYMVIYGGEHISKIDINDATKIIDKVPLMKFDGTHFIFYSGSKNESV